MLRRIAAEGMRRRYGDPLSAERMSGSSSSWG